MRFAHVTSAASADPRLALVRDGRALLVAPLFDGAPDDLQDLISGGDEMLARVRDAADASAEWVPVDGLGFASAVSRPPVVLAVGLSLGRIPVLAGQLTWAALGLFGVWYIARRVPTKR